MSESLAPERAVSPGMDERFAINGGVWRAVLLGAGIGLAIGLVLVGLSSLIHGGAPTVPILSVPTAVGALLQLLRTAFHDMVPLDQRIEHAPATTGEYFRRLRLLERRLQAGSTDPSKYEWTLRPMLAQLAADRLRHKHGITVRREPEQARAILGEQLWLIMTTPSNEPHSAPDRRQLTALVAAIEAI